MNTRHGDVNILIAQAVSHDVAKEAAEHEEHLTHVLHQLQKNVMRFMLFVCFSCSSNGVWLSMLFNRWHKRAGLRFV
jgi:hypothetical protein